MFTPARFIVIDNELSHMEAIRTALQALGTPCLGIHYDGSTLNPSHFEGVRVLLLDLHLLSGGAATDDKAHFGLIAGLLEDNMDKDGGPFVIILWTQHPQKADELKKFLDDRLASHARPLAVIPMDKARYIPADKSAVQEPAKLREELSALVLYNPQIRAILSWEAEVHGAASRTLASLLRLIPDAEKTTDKFPSALDRLLSLLARAAVGEENVERDVRGAINTALAPIISDRLHAMNDQVSADLWKVAVTKYKDKIDLGHDAAAAVNQMLHVEAAGSPPSTWGAVVEFPPSWLADEEFTAKFGTTFKQVYEKNFKLSDADVGACRPVLVRVGAACDYAQRKPGPIPYVFGLAIPVAKVPNNRSLPEAVWTSPRLALSIGTGNILASCLLLVALPEHVAAKLSTLCRFREQLLMELISKISAHLSRPGKISV